VPDRLEREALLLHDIEDPENPVESLSNPGATRRPKRPKAEEPPPPEPEPVPTFRGVVELYERAVRKPSTARHERPTFRSARLAGNEANTCRALLRRSRSINQKPVGKLRRADFVHLAETMRRRGDAPGYRNRLLRIARRALRWGHLDGRCPALDFSVPVPKMPQHPTALTAEEVGRLLAAAEPATRLLLAVAVVSGCRHSELARLRVRDVVDGMAGMHLSIRETKSGEDRTVPITAGVAKALRAHIAGKPRDWPVFGARRDPSRPVQSYYAHVRKAFEDAGLYHKDLRPGLHALRRTAATTMLAKGHSLATTMRILGWSLLGTAQSYAASSDREQRAAVAAAEAALGLGGGEEDGDRS